MHTPQATHFIETPLNAIGAVSIIRIISDDVASTLDTLEIRSMEIGQIRLVSILGLDEALIARFDSDSILIMPHGGIGITRAISQALSAQGIASSDTLKPETQFPEAQDLHEARMLAALAIAPSPLAMDTLLEQPSRWRAIEEAAGTDSEEFTSPYLDRLITPPIVVAVGCANIGKSSLVNALAGDSIAMVSDYAGTTRDHVGVMLNLAGLVVRWVDTPGIDGTVEIGDELDLVEPVIKSADLVVHAVDLSSKSDHTRSDLDPRLVSMIGDSSVLKVGVRSDLAADSGSDSSDINLACSSKTGDGIETLAKAVRDQLVPAEHLQSTNPWRFWN